MRFVSALSSSLIAIFMLMLPLTGVAKHAAEVESRSQPSRWESESAEEARNPQSYGGVELTQKMEFLQQEVQELRGKIEEQAFQVQQLQDHQKKLYLDLERRLSEGRSTKASGITGISLDEPEGQNSALMAMPENAQSSSSEITFTTSTEEKEIEETESD